MNISSETLQNSNGSKPNNTESIASRKFQLPLLKIAAPLISVIIPVYNGAKYIQIALDSVLEQTYSNYEIIVIDDGSTDDTRQKLEPYKNKIRYVYQENQGSAAARNTGTSLAKGELIAFLDSDDFWTMSNKLEKQVALFEENPSLGGINTGWKIVDSAGKILKTVQPWHKAPKLDLETWLKKKCVRTSAMVFRKEWLEKVGGFDEDLRQSHDVDLILRLSLAGCETFWLKEVTVSYRQHETNTTKNSLKQAKYVQAVLDKFFSRNDLPESISIQESQIRYHTLVWIAWYQYRAGNLNNMTNFLQKSLNFSPYLKVENLSHWFSSFTRFSKERGEEFDVDIVTSSSQWHQLIATILGLSTISVNKPAALSLYTKSSPPVATFPIVERQVERSNLSNQNNNLQTSSVVSSIIEKTQIERSNTFSQIEPQINSNSAILETESQSKIPLDPKSVEITNKSVAELVTLADEKAKQQELKTAVYLYAQALEIEPDAWKIHRQLGKIYRQQGLLDLALVHLKKSVAIQPNIGEIHSDIGLTLAQLGKWDEAIAAYTKGIKIKPEQPWSYFKLAALQEKQHEFAAAAESLQKAISYDTNNSLFYRNLAQVQQLRGNLDESIAAYRQAIKANPDLELTVYRNLGQAIKHNAIVKPRLGLQSLAAELKTKVGKIAYLGGSPTAQPNGYTPLLQNMLEDYFGQAHTIVKVGNGGITSNAAVFTMDQDIILHQPDLCLIEYGATDMGKGYSVVHAVEGMVKKLIAIGCHICFLYMYKQGEDFSGNDPVLIEYEKVAEFYGIPSINIGKYLEKLAKQGKLTIADLLLKSKEKTSITGSKIVAEFVLQGLQKIFATSNQTEINSFNHHYHQDRYINSNNYADGKIVRVEPSMLVNRHNYQIGRFKSYQYLQIDDLNEIKFTIEGELVGIMVIIGQDSSVIRLDSTTYQKEYKLWDSFCFEDRLQALIVQRYFKQPTLVTLKLTDKEVDYTQCVQKTDPPPNKRFKMIGILLCGRINNS